MPPNKGDWLNKEQIPQNSNNTATTMIKRLSVVLFDEIKNLKAKPKTTPITKQINILAIGHATSANDNPVPVEELILTQSEIEIV